MTTTENTRTSLRDRFKTGIAAAAARVTPAKAALAEQVDAALTGKPRPLNATDAHRHLLNTPEGVWAFYALGGIDWAMRTPEARATVITEQMFRYADMIGHTVWLRCLSSPFPYRDYAEQSYKDTPSPLKTPPGTSTFADYIDAAQLYSIGFGARRSFAVIGVLFDEYHVKDNELPRLLQETPLPAQMGQLERLRRQLRAVTTSMARAGFDATPLTPRELRWVIHASLGIGAPIPPAIIGDHDTPWGDTAAAGSFTGPVRSVEKPSGLTTTVSVIRDSREYTNDVAVLHVEDFGERDLTRHDLTPFLAWADTLPYGVDACAVYRVLDGRDLVKAAELDRRRGNNIREHYEEHGDEPPAQVLRGIVRARDIEDEVTNGSRETACRVQGVVMFAVTGENEEVCLENARDLTLQAARDQHMTLVHDYGQWASYRAFTPGEPCPMTGHVTRMPASFAATAVPNVTSVAGDRSGMMVGNVAGSSDLLVFDPHGGPKRNKSGMWVIGADPGAGKSYTAGAFIDLSARSGVPTVAYDPSGPWARLCDMPHLRADSRHLSLTSAHRGVLSPYVLVPAPRREDYPGEDQWRQALADAEAERMGLAVDTFRDLLPPSMVTGDRTGAVEGAIEAAVTDVGGAHGTDPWLVVDRLTRMGEAGQAIADRLESRSQLTGGALVFPPKHASPDDTSGPAMLNQATLTVVTMEGLTLPPKGQPDRTLWSREALASVPVLRLGAWLAMNTIYRDKQRKTVTMDEIGISMGGASSFGPFAARASADSRKWNASVSLVFQNPEMLLNLSGEISNLIGAAWIGRMEEAAALAALPFLRLDPGHGYEQAIATLETGEFLVRDWRGRVRKVRVDNSWWHPDLLDALNTNPHGTGRVAEVDDLIVAGAH